MADPIPRLLLQMQGWTASLEANHEDTMEMLALQLRGHPRAQDFEPTGHGGSDPTSVNGTMADRAAHDGKRYIAAIQRAWKSLREADDIAHDYCAAVPPIRKQGDIQDVWCVLHLEREAMEPRAHLDLCDPCYRFKATRGRYPTPQEVDYQITHYGRWPTQRVDPTKPRPDPMRLASVERLQLHTAALTGEEAADVLRGKE